LTSWALYGAVGLSLTTLAILNIPFSGVPHKVLAPLMCLGFRTLEKRKGVVGFCQIVTPGVVNLIPLFGGEVFFTTVSF